MKGRVIANYGQTAAVEDPRHRIVRCNIRKKLGLVVCGDHVEWYPQADSSGVIESVLPRKSALERPDRRGQLKALAANLNQILIVIAPKPKPDPFMIDAYLVHARHMGVNAAIIINKQDIISETDQQTLTDIERLYQKLDYPVTRVSCKTSYGLDKLKAQLKKSTSILVGQSGVGKSSITNALLPDQNIQINAISMATGLGNHTTTITTLYKLPSGGELIDSPGVREFVVSHHSKAEIETGFIEFERFATHCKFNNCSHLHEPGCAILDAVAKNKISAQRWQHYKKMLNSLNENT